MCIFLSVRHSTDHFHSAEYMTEMVAALQILGDVSKSAEVIWVLGSARDIPDLMFCDYGLMKEERDMDRKEVSTNWKPTTNGDGDNQV